MSTYERRSHFASNEVGDSALELMEDGEGEGDVKNDSRESWRHTTVEACNALIFVDLGEAVGEAVVLVRVNTLHLSLDDIDWVVSHDGAETGESTG